MIFLSHLTHTLIYAFIAWTFCENKKKLLNNKLRLAVLLKKNFNMLIFYMNN